MNQEPLDVVAVLVFVLTIVTSNEVAIIFGPYAAIVVSASAGAAVSLAMIVKDMPKWWQPMYYILSRIVIATVLTVAIAELIHSQLPEVKPRALLVPVAVCFGLIWDYGAALRWSKNAVRKALPGWLANLGKRDG